MPRPSHVFIRSSSLVSCAGYESYFKLYNKMSASSERFPTLLPQREQPIKQLIPPHDPLELDRLHSPSRHDPLIRPRHVPPDDLHFQTRPTRSLRIQSPRSGHTAWQIHPLLLQPDDIVDQDGEISFRRFLLSVNTDVSRSRDVSDGGERDPSGDKRICRRMYARRMDDEMSSTMFDIMYVKSCRPRSAIRLESTVFRGTLT